jgi:hypothetical protein
MPRQRAGILAVRAVNQYRRRDVLTYLALRYYLDNEAARTDHWVKEVATDLILKRSNQPYFRAFHFKDGSHRSGVEHRLMFLLVQTRHWRKQRFLQNAPATRRRLAIRIASSAINWRQEKIGRGFLPITPLVFALGMPRSRKLAMTALMGWFATST